MEHTDRSLVAWTLAVAAVILSVFGSAYYLASRHVPLPSQNFGFRGFPTLLAIEFALTGLILAKKRPGNRIGWLFLIGAVGAGLQGLSEAFAIWAVAGKGSTTVIARLAAVGEDWVWMLGFGSGALTLALFPDGKPLSRRWSRWIWVCVAGTLVSVVAFVLTTRPLVFSGVDNPLGVRGMYEISNATIVFFFLLLLTGLASLVVRFRRTVGEEHEQMKWLASSAVIVVGAFTVYFIVYMVTRGDASSPVANVLESLIVFGVATIPVSIGVGVLKYRLYDIDVVIRKTVVFGIAAVMLTGVFVVAAVLIGVVVSGNDTTVHVVVALGVGLLFEPARRLATRIADRLVFGGRATPYEVLTEFTRRASGAYETADVLPRIAQIAAAGVGATGARVWVRVGDVLQPQASTGDLGPVAPVPVSGTELPTLPDDHAVAVVHRGELLGAIGVTMPANDPMTSEKARLVDDLAAQAGAVLANVRLIEELRASRQRLVAAHDEERRRIERNIHDGAQQQLVALTVKLRLAEQLADRDAAKTKEMLAQLQMEATEALEDLRDLARGIYPPLLADKGLVAALESQARKAPVPTTVDADGIGRYPQEAEAAVYFCCLEALQNVAKYANASRVTLTLSDGDGRLAFTVVDDGAGFDTAHIGYGTGLQGMADRLAALNGYLEVRSEPGNGTTVTGALPALAIGVVG